MKAMRKRFLAAGLGLAVVSLIASDASATRFTETAKFYVANGTPSGGPPLQAMEVQGLSGGGGLFTNTTGLLAMGGGAVTINTVGANIIKGVDLNPGPNATDIISPINLGSANADNVMVIFALSGTAIPTSVSSATATFTTGTAWVISFDQASLAAGFEPDSPLTWQFDPSRANLLAVYALAPQEDVTQGLNGDTIGNPPVTGVPASATNVSAINLINDTLSQGILLFDFVENGDALPIGPHEQFQVNVPPGELAALPFPLSGEPGTEGLVVISAQSNPSDATGFTFHDGGAIDTDEEVLNSIMTALLGTSFSTPGGGFAAFDPGAVGDFYNEFDINANPTSQAAVPEPATMMLGVMGLAGFALRRRKA